MRSDFSCMAGNSYYVDTCIWLNLFKKEGDLSKGKPYWKIAEEFIEKIILSEFDEIAYSGVILRELQLNLGQEEYDKNRKLFDKIEKFKKIDVLEEDKKEARKLESRYNFEISFYDLMHIIISRRLNLIFITRDKKLIELAKENDVVVKKPEEIL